MAALALRTDLVKLLRKLCCVVGAWNSYHGQCINCSLVLKVEFMADKSLSIMKPPDNENNSSNICQQCHLILNSLLMTITFSLGGHKGHLLITKCLWFLSRLPFSEFTRLIQISLLSRTFVWSIRFKMVGLDTKVLLWSMDIVTGMTTRVP